MPEIVSFSWLSCDSSDSRFVECKVMHEGKYGGQNRDNAPGSKKRSVSA
jgi:hypothetical protein